MKFETVFIPLVVLLVAACSARPSHEDNHVSDSDERSRFSSWLNPLRGHLSLRSSSQFVKALQRALSGNETRLQDLLQVKQVQQVLEEMQRDLPNIFTDIDADSVMKALSGLTDSVSERGWREITGEWWADMEEPDVCHGLTGITDSMKNITDRSHDLCANSPETLQRNRILQGMVTITQVLLDQMNDLLDALPISSNSSQAATDSEKN